MAVTIKDIAREAGIDIRVVSLTLRNHPDAKVFREEVRQRVLRIANELGYQRNLLATSMRTGVVNTVAIVGNFLEMDAFPLPGVAGVMEECARFGYNVRLYQDKDLEKTFSEIRGNCLKHILSMSVDHEERQKTAEFCSVNQIKLVYLCEGPSMGYSAVGIDNFAAGFSAVRFFAEKGHRRIGLATVPERAYQYIKARNSGYLEGMKAAGISPDPDWIIEDGENHDCLDRFLKMEKTKRPTAVFAISDSIAVRLLYRAALLGIRVPEELSVAGFGNTSMTRLSPVPLATFEELFFERGKLAVDILLGKSHDPVKKEDHFYLVEPRLIPLRSAGGSLIQNEAVAQNVKGKGKCP